MMYILLLNGWLGREFSYFCNFQELIQLLSRFILMIFASYFRMIKKRTQGEKGSNKVIKSNGKIVMIWIIVKSLKHIKESNENQNCQKTAVTLITYDIVLHLSPQCDNSFLFLMQDQRLITTRTWLYTDT